MKKVKKKINVKNTWIFKFVILQCERNKRRFQTLNDNKNEKNEEKKQLSRMLGYSQNYLRNVKLN